MQALSRHHEETRETPPSRREAMPIFRSLAVGQSRPRRTVFIATSVLLHVGVLGLLALHRRAASQPNDVQVRVALVAPWALRPATREAPPAAQTAEKRTSPKTTQPRHAPKPLLAPKEIVPVTQPQAPAEEPEPEEVGDEDTGGDSQGVASGHGGGTGPAVAPAPPPPPPTRASPPTPVFENENNVRRRRIAGHDPFYPARAESNGIEGVVVAKVVISADGRVSDVVVMQTHPLFETAVRDAIAGWKFSPLVVNGKATTVYTIFRFTFKLR